MDNFEVMEFNKFTQNNHGDPFANIPMTDIDIGRESIPILELSNSFGRESLGILKLGCDNNTFNTNLSPNNELDQAFLLSDLKSASTINSNNFSFNLKATDLADFPNSFQFTNSNNILNDGFLYTTVLSEKFLQQYRSRFNSVPVFNNKNKEETGDIVKKFLNRASEGCQINTSVIEEEGNEFNDSVFIEARHLSTKFKEEGSHDGFILDETDPPELINGDLENSNNIKEEKVKYDSEKVFQEIDKLLPVDGLQKLNNKLDNRSLEQWKHQDGGITSHSSIKEFEGPSSTEPHVQSSDLITLSDCRKNEMNEKSDKSVNVKNNSISNGRIYTEEPEKILQALSVILAKSDRSEKETEEGQCLVNTLKEMLSNNSKERSKLVVNDSSKSINGTSKLQSISTQSQDGSQLINSTPANHTKTRKSNSFSYPNKALKPKLTSGVARSPSFDGSKTRNSVSSAESSVEVRNFSTENPPINLKLKKGNSAAIRRGPMKATVPIENITRPHVKGTPTKAQQVMPKLKSRISTPIRDLHIKPMAQSTPDNKTNGSSSSMELTNVRSLSSSNVQEQSIRSSPATSVSSHHSIPKDRPQNSQLPRRNSVSEGRKSKMSELKRNSSMKESSLMKAMNKIRQNIAVTKGPLRDCSNLSSRESFSTSGKIVTTPKRVMRAVGKENTSAVC